MCSEDRAQRSSGAVLANAEDGLWTAGREDSDAAASIEVPIHDCKKPTCIHVDEIAGKCNMHHGQLRSDSSLT